MQPSNPIEHASRLRRIGYCLLPVLLGAGAALVLLVVAGRPPRPAYAATLTFPGCASTIQGCIDGASPGDTILINAGDYTESLTLNKAVSLTGALSSTTILHALPATRVLTVTGAAVDSSVVISGLTFIGGSALGGPCPDGCGGAVLITGTALPRLQNLLVSNNTAESTGGGVYADGSLYVADTQFVSNTALVVGFGGLGGGLYAGGSVTLTADSFFNNRAYQGAGFYAVGAALVTGSQFVSNTAGSSGGGLFLACCGAGVNLASVQTSLFQNNHCMFSSCQGGGLYVAGALALSDSLVVSNTSDTNGAGAYATGVITLSSGLFQNNRCLQSYCAGGGLYANDQLAMTGTQFVSNTAGSGGGLSALSLVAAGGSFISNTAVYAYGGGVSAGTATLSGTQFVGNIGGPGGGLYTPYYAILTNTVFVDNRQDGAYVSGATVLGGLFERNSCGCSGGGLYSSGPLAVTGTQFISNSAGGDGGGVDAFTSGSVTLQSALFQGNQAGGFGGGLYFLGSTLVSGTQFFSNTAGSGGGGAAGFNCCLGVLVESSSFEGNSCTAIGCSGGALSTHYLTLNDSLILSNTAALGSGGGVYVSSFSGVHGGRFQNNQADVGGGLVSNGGLTMNGTQFLNNTAVTQGSALDQSGSAWIANGLFANNSATGSDAVLHFGSYSNVQMLHATIVGTGTASGTAINIETGTVGITDTIIASYTTGISQTAGTVFQDYNLFFGNGTNTSGTVSGGVHSLVGDPLFVNAAGDDYHLSPGSLAIDAGTNAGVMTDFEGDPRPLGTGFDIGFDESPYTALADVGVVKSASAAMRQPGQTLTYTLIFSNAGPDIATGVRLTDIVPASLLAITYTSSGTVLTPVGLTNYAWQVANLAPGAGGVVTVTGLLSGSPHGTVFTNTATITTASVDSNTSNNTSAVSMTVANVPPVAADDVYTVTGNSTLTVTAPGVLANDTDANNDPLTAVLVTPPPSGTLYLHADGSFTYTPPHGFAGVVTFNYRANDGVANSNIATVTITVTAVEHKLFLPLVIR